MAVTKSFKDESRSDWELQLSDPEIQESLTILLQKLPRIKEAVLFSERAIDFVAAVSQDEETLQKFIGNAGKELSAYHLNEESLRSLTTLIKKLPNIIKVVSVLEDLLEFGKNVLQDDDSLDYIKEGMEEMATPIFSPLKEAKERTEQDNQQVSIFTLLKWLKEPQVQKGLKYVHALLEVYSEKHKK
ncbi:hypothetical protein [Alteribacillus sp. YIM 98480]|uniref:hypothetical protein n=1 Tax=Alteribacillus sp. YIM 98480 TaxID=2606599 RepID=UPI00131E48B5|nr:hypothetical protein [Alteribacillus sp. YIM 98480]